MSACISISQIKLTHTCRSSVLLYFHRYCRVHSARLYPKCLYYRFTPLITCVCMCFCVNNIVSVGFIIRIKIPSIVCVRVWYDFSASMHTQSHRNHQLELVQHQHRPYRTNILCSIRFEMLYFALPGTTTVCSFTHVPNNVMRILSNAVLALFIYRRCRAKEVFGSEWYKFILTV